MPERMREIPLGAGIGGSVHSNGGASEGAFIGVRKRVGVSPQLRADAEGSVPFPAPEPCTARIGYMQGAKPAGRCRCRTEPLICG